MNNAPENDEVVETFEAEQRRALEELRKTLVKIGLSVRILGYATIVLFVLLAGVISFNVYRGNQVHNSLCDVQASERQAVFAAQAEFDRGARLVAEHPGILDQFGITRQEYERDQNDEQEAIHEQRATVRALDNLNC